MNTVEPDLKHMLFTDSASLRATSPYFDYFTVHEYAKIELPCLASHPSIEVSLMKV